nr:hypothetical protein [Tanacetum cinerariifolium]
MAQPIARNHVQRGTHKQYAQMTLPNPQRHVVPAVVLTQSKPVPITVVRPVSTVVLKISVTRPRQAKTIVTKFNSPPKRLINHSPSPKASNSPPIVTAVKAPMVNAAKDRLLALEVVAGCLPLAEVDCLGPAATVRRGVTVVSELLLVFQTLALGLGGVAPVATA